MRIFVLVMFADVNLLANVPLLRILDTSLLNNIYVGRVRFGAADLAPPFGRRKFGRWTFGRRTIGHQNFFF